MDIRQITRYQLKLEEGELAELQDEIALVMQLADNYWGEPPAGQERPFPALDRIASMAAAVLGREPEDASDHFPKPPPPAAVQSRPFDPGQWLPEGQRPHDVDGDPDSTQLLLAAVPTPPRWPAQIAE